jgi:hypothetical protein
LEAKLCFAVAKLIRMPKQSLGDNVVPKPELGNESCGCPIGTWERAPNPPYPPLEKGGENAAFKSPFFKGGFRGIIKMILF